MRSTCAGQGQEPVPRLVLQLAVGYDVACIPHTGEFHGGSQAETWALLDQTVCIELQALTPRAERAIASGLVMAFQAPPKPLRADMRGAST